MKSKTQRVVADYIERAHTSLIEDCKAILERFPSALEIDRDAAEQADKLLAEGAWLAASPRECSALRRLALKINTQKKEGHIE